MKLLIMLWGMCVTYTRLLPNFSLVGHTTNYGYNAQWLSETITDTYNTIATPPWHRYTTLSEMAQSVHNLAEGLKTPDARAIEKSTVAIFEVELKNESK